MGLYTHENNGKITHEFGFHIVTHQLTLLPLVNRVSNSKQCEYSIAWYPIVYDTWPLKMRVYLSIFYLFLFFKYLFNILRSYNYTSFTSLWLLKMRVALSMSWGRIHTNSINRLIYTTIILLSSGIHIPYNKPLNIMSLVALHSLMQVMWHGIGICV